MEYADLALAAVGAFALAWLADLMGGRRGLFAATLVSGVGTLCGWFLVVRVFGVATMDDWRWAPWSLAASAVCLAAYHLFRSKR